MHFQGNLWTFIFKFKLNHLLMFCSEDVLYSLQIRLHFINHGMLIILGNSYLE